MSQAISPGGRKRGAFAPAPGSEATGGSAMTDICSSTDTAGPIVTFYRAIPESFSPMTFYLQWDGTDVIWTHDDADTWYPLAMEHFPNFAEYFDRLAPDDIKGFAPPFLSRSFFPGVVQIWSGFFVKTAPGWSLLVRPPVNLPRSQTFECYEGILETDRWFGPLFINIRLTATDRPIEINHKKPLFQAQPLIRQTYAEEHLRASTVVDELAALSPAD